MEWLRKKLNFLVTDSPNDEVQNKENNLMRNIKLIKNLSADDLDEIEKDLSFYEKVSLVFLLYGKDNPHLALQQLIVSSKNPTAHTQFLSNWQRNEILWQEILIESLTIANINHVLLKIGLDIEDLKQKYLPSNLEINLNVHPILKGLYIMCELLTPNITEEFIQYMELEFEISDYIHTSEFLELHLLDWICKKYIKIGEWNPISQVNVVKREFCDLAHIEIFLKSKEMDNIKDKLHNLTVRFNFTKNNMIGRDNSTKCDKSGDENFKTCIKETNYRKPKTSKSELNIDKEQHSDRYNINKSNAGYLYIINQTYFYKDKFSNKNEKNLNPRKGTTKDCDKLIETFKVFGFEPIVDNDLTHSQISLSIRKMIKLSESKDSLIVCILSHGRRGSFYSSNSVEIRIDDVKNMITCKELQGKPKFLIIQACQNESTEEEDDGEYKLEQDGNPESRYDMLTAWSTVPGHVSYRHIEEGSWFIQTICFVIEKYGKTHHMLDILTEVNNILSKKKGSENEKMTPNWETNLCKKFYLPIK